MQELTELFCKSLEKQEVEFIFGMPGSHILPLYNEFTKKTNIKIIDVFHENTASFMAGMYGHLTGKTGVAMLTAGPGATNSMTGVAQAYSASYPMLVVTGGVPCETKNESFHGNDSNMFLSNMFTHITKKSFRVENVDDIDNILSEAFYITISGRPGPVHIEIPIDIQKQKISKLKKAIPFEKKIINKSNRSEIKQIVAALSQSRRPMICVGQGINIHKANDELLQLSKILSAPVLISTYATGALETDYIYNVGYFSEFSENSFAYEVLNESDCLLIIGMRSNTKMLDSIESYMPRNTFLIALDDESSLCTNNKFKCSIIENSKDFLREILTYYKTIKKTTNTELEKRIYNAKEIIRNGINLLLSEKSPNNLLHFGRVIQSLITALDNDCIAFSGVGNHHVWSKLLHPITNPNSYIAESSWGSMGGEVAGAICAKLLYPEKQVIAYTGDGSMLMVASDISTAVAANANILIIILNDSRYGIINGLQQLHFSTSIGDILPNISFAMLAESMGAKGITIYTEKDIDKKINDALSLLNKNTVVIDIKCNFDIPWPTDKKILEAGSVQ